MKRKRAKMKRVSRGTSTVCTSAKYFHSTQHECLYKISSEILDCSGKMKIVSSPFEYSISSFQPHKKKKTSRE